MSFNEALTSPQYELVREETASADYYVTLCQNTVLLHGTITNDLAVLQTWALFGYTLVSGDFNDVKENMVLLMGTGNDIMKATFQGRTRRDYITGDVATTGIVYCGENSQNFTTGDYFWIVNSFDIDYKLSRPDGQAVEQVDYNYPYAGPEPMVVGLRLAYVGNANDSGVMRISIDVSDSYAVADGETIDSYQFTFAAGTYTVISGGLNQSTLVIDIEPGEQWAELVVIDTAGISKTRNFYINVHDDDNPPNFGFSNPDITGDIDNGWTMPIPALVDVSNTLPNTFCVVWRVNETYGGEADTLYDDNNIAFIGWFQREDDEAKAGKPSGVTEEAKFEFTGVVPRMARLFAQLLGLTLSDAPTIWGELVNLTPWRGICHFLSRYTTVANMVDVDFDSKDDTFLFPAISTQGGNVKEAVGGIGKQFDALLESASDGRSKINRRAEFLDQTERDALTVVANFTNEDCAVRIVRQLEQNTTVGKVDADGAFYNPTNGQVTVITSRAPGHAQGEAQGSDTLSAQILAATNDTLAAKGELNQRSGNQLNVSNNTEILEAEFPDGYAPIFQAPSHAQLYTFTVDQLAANGVDRIVYNDTTFWMLENIRIGRLEKGRTTVVGTFRKLPPIGSPGDDTTKLPENFIDNPTPDLGQPAFNFESPSITFPDAGLSYDQINPVMLQPPVNQVIATNGQTLIAKTLTQSHLLKNYIALQRPDALEITPPDLGSFEIKQVLFDPFSTRNAVGAYVLASDGDNSAVWYTPNAASPSRTWTKGEEVLGVYTVIRAGNIPGGVLIYSPISEPVVPGPWSVSFPFELNNNAGWTTLTVDVGIPGVYATITGWSHGDFQSPTANYYRGVFITLTFSSTTLESIGVDFDLTKGDFISPSVNTAFFIDTSSGAKITRTHDQMSDGSGQNITWSGSDVGATSVTVGLVSSYQGSAAYTGAVRIPSITLAGTATNPFAAASGDAVVCASSNYGGNLSSPVSIGTSPGNVGGMDIQRAGGVNYAALDAAVKKATSIGGSYSAFATFTNANPVCIIIPYYRMDSITTRQTAASDPDVIVALDQADTDGGTLYFVEGDGTKNDITPVAGMTFETENCVTISYGRYIAVIGNVSSVYKLYTSDDAGSSWVFVKNLTTPAFIRVRRNDDTILDGGGQLYVTNGDSIDFSSRFASNGTFPRTMPVTDIDGFDILG